jgi:hypothetical protein
MRPEFYGIALWILSGCALVTSVIILVVSLVAPQVIHPNWLDPKIFRRRITPHCATKDHYLSKTATEISR